MFAYSMASAHHKLPHLRLDQFMVSNVDAGGEGWEYIDKLDDVCSYESINIQKEDLHPLPTFLHFCQFYRAGEWAFNKRIVPKDIFTCGSPLFAIPPPSIQEEQVKVKGVGQKATTEPLTPRQAKRNAFMICSLTKIINEALREFKDLKCDGEQVNFEESIRIFR